MSLAKDYQPWKEIPTTKKEKGEDGRTNNDMSVFGYEKDTKLETSIFGMKSPTKSVSTLGIKGRRLVSAIKQ